MAQESYLWAVANSGGLLFEALFTITWRTIFFFLGGSGNICRRLPHGELTQRLEHLRISLHLGKYSTPSTPTRQIVESGTSDTRAEPLTGSL